MLEARGLTLWRGHNCLFERLKFRVTSGTALILRGPNGSGKTTLLRVLCGLTRPEAGELFWDGKLLADGLRGMVAYSGHQPGLNADLTVQQNLAFYARLSRNVEGWRHLVPALGLERRTDLEVRYLSAGQKRRAGIARVLMSSAPAWLLDEPFTNLDSAGRRVVEDHIGTHLSAGGLAIIAAHEDMLASDRRASTLTMDGPDQ
jgi:heme exporter protein A